MASPWKLLLLRRNLSRALKPLPFSSSASPPSASSNPLDSLTFRGFCKFLPPLNCLEATFSAASRSLCTYPSIPDEQSQGPAAIDYRSLLQEDEFHKLADSTIQDLQEKFEEYGDSVQIDGFDIDYGNQVLTLKLGALGTYVLNKQAPNRQIWMSSPVSGPSRFDWDRNLQAWIYRRTKAKLLDVLEEEVGKLCGQPICL